MRQIYLSLILLFLGKILFGQDPINTAYFYNRLDLNPSYAGGDGEGRLRTSIFSNSSFNGIRGPFNYSTASLDYGFCQFSNTIVGIGFIVSNETQGDGFLKITKADAVASVIQHIGKDQTLAFGFRTGYIWQTVDWEEFTFSDQFDPIRGIVNKSMATNTEIDYSSVNNWNVGIRYNNWSGKKLYWMVGATLNNAFEPNIGLLNQYKLLQRFSVHSAFLHRPMPNYIEGSFMLQGRYDIQGNFSLLSLASEYYMNEKLNFGFGLKMVTNKPNIKNMYFPSIIIGYQPKPTMKIIFVCETNISGISYAGTLNTFELGIIFSPRQKICGFGDIRNVLLGSGPEKPPVLSCPKFFNSKSIQTF